MSDHARHNECATHRTAFWYGILCIAFCVGAVLVRGVRWDETYEYAKILSGQIPYPDGHPNVRYLRAALSVQTYSATALVSLGSGPLLLCALRNMLFLVATIMPVYLMTNLISRRPLWAVAAAVFVLQGIMLEFDGSYPTGTWPLLYSNGHIGSAYAVLVLYAVMARRFRLAAFLFGVMPCVHMGQLPPLLGLFALFAAKGLVVRDTALLKRVLPYLAAGAGLCVVLFLYQRSLQTPPPTEGPYYSAEDPTAVWKSYTALHDGHRMYPPGNGHVLMVGTILLTALLTWRTLEPGLRRTYGCVLAYVSILGATVWIIMLVHGLVGEEIPFLLIGWMPYRLPNHVPPICISVVAGVLAARGFSGQVVLAGALAIGALRPVLQTLLSAGVYDRYLHMGDGIAFGLYGAALAWAVAGQAEGLRNLRAAAGVAIALAVVATLGAYHQFGAACVGAGMVIGLVCRYRLPYLAPRPKAFQRVAVVIGCVAVLMLLRDEWRHRETLRVSEFDRSARAYFETLEDPAAPLLTRFDEYFIQSRIGQPFIIEVTTASIMTYVPELAPVIDRMYQDLYGLSFLPPEDVPALNDGLRWEERWHDRSPDEWQVLGMKYGFRHVVAPPGVELNLKPVVSTESNTLYLIGVE